MRGRWSLPHKNEKKRPKEAPDGKVCQSLRAFSRERGGVTVIVVIVGDTIIMESGSVMVFVDVKQSEVGNGVG